MAAEKIICEIANTSSQRAIIITHGTDQLLLIPVSAEIADGSQSAVTAAAQTAADYLATTYGGTGSTQVMSAAEV